jgi:hypothetical protein
MKPLINAKNKKPATEATEKHGKIQKAGKRKTPFHVTNAKGIMNVGRNK